MARKQLIQRDGEDDKDFARRVKIRENQWRYVDSHMDEIRARNSAWNKAHPETIRKNGAAYYQANKQKRYASHRKWAAANPEKMGILRARQVIKRRALIRLGLAERRVAVKRATPSWANRREILAIYAEAIRISDETGVKYVVDHYYPLVSDIVCGLHVEDNLRVITFRENAWKSNRMPGEPASAAGPFVP